MVACDGEHAWIETERSGSCGGCAASKGCGTAVLGRYFASRQHRVRALNPLQAEVNERVVVGLDEAVLVRGSLAVYIVPLLALIVVAGAAELVAPQWGLADSGWFVPLAAAVGLGFGLLWLRRFSRSAACDPRYTPVILRRLEGERAAIPIHISIQRSSE